MADKFWREIYAVIDSADIIVHIVDARWGEMGVSKHVIEFCQNRQRPLIFAFNKSDLINESQAKQLLSKFKPSCTFSATEFTGSGRMRELIGMTMQRIDKEKVNIGIVGYPNSGKSSFINAMGGGGAAIASSRAGTTKGVQNVRISKKIMLIDTPGVIPIDELPEDIKILIDSKNSDQLRQPLAVINTLLEFLIKTKNTEWIEQIYGVRFQEYPDVEDFLDQVAIKKKRLKKGGVPDTQLVAREILDSWQKGKYLKKGKGKSSSTKKGASRA